jgi:hypothetical protein
MKALHILTILGCLCGGFTLLNTFMTANGAPQEGAGAAIAAAFAVIPYCFVRAIELWAAPGETQLRKLNETLTTHTRLLAQLANASIEERQEDKAIIAKLPESH